MNRSHLFATSMLGLGILTGSLGVDAAEYDRCTHGNVRLQPEGPEILPWSCDPEDPETVPTSEDAPTVTAELASVRPTVPSSVPPSAEQVERIVVWIRWTVVALR